MRRTGPIIVGFEGGERKPQAKECGWPLDHGKFGKETNFTLEPLERNADALAP